MLRIRAAAPEDAPALQELYLRHLTAYPPPEPPDTDTWQAMLAGFAADPNYHILLGEDGGRVVSSVTLVVIPNLTHNLRPYAVMENVVTHADFRGRGHASALIARAAEIAREQGCYKIMLLTGSKKESTLRFYEQNGFDSSVKTAFLMRL